MQLHVRRAPLLIAGLVAHLESLFKIVLLLQEETIVDDDLGSGYLKVNDAIVHCFG